MKAQVIEIAEEHRKRAKKIRKFLGNFADEIDRVEHGLATVEPWFIRAEIDINQKAIDLSYSGDKHVLQGVFAAFRKLGYEPGSRPKEDELITSFQCYWNHPTLAIRFWLTFSSTVCKRVKVGVKMVEQPVYETVCE